MKNKDKIYVWACDVNDYRGEGILAINFPYFHIKGCFNIPCACNCATIDSSRQGSVLKGNITITFNFSYQSICVIS